MLDARHCSHPSAGSPAAASPGTLPAVGPLPLGLAVVFVAALACGGCGGSSTPDRVPPDPSEPFPISPRTQLPYRAEAHRGGQASALRLVGVQVGRLVELRDVDGRLIHADLVVGEDIRPDGVDYRLDQNAITTTEIVTILHPFGSAAFDAAYDRLDDNLVDVLEKGLQVNELPPFTMVPRNAALSLRFDDLLDDGQAAGEQGSVGPDTVQVLVGNPPTQVFPARVFPDPNHGGVVDGRFHSTRVVVDLAVSSLEAAATGLPVNALGLPEAQVKSQANLALRIPTSVSPSVIQFELLRNLSGTALSFTGNGPNDPLSPTLDVVRAMRSGGGQVGDPNNGFLVDDLPPQVLGAQAVQVDFLAITGPGEYLVDVTYGTALCAAPAVEGDVLQLPGYTLLVTGPSGNRIGALVEDVPLRVIVGDAAGLDATQTAVGQYRTTWDPASGAAPECFVRFSPSGASPPWASVSVQADVLLSFSEPMDPSSLQPFGSFELEYGAGAVNPLHRRVVGAVVPSIDLRDFAFQPVHPLRHHGDPSLPPETYRILLENGPGGVRDLAGNALAEALPPLTFQIDPAQPRVETGGVAFDFGSSDEDLNGAPEVRGQFLRDLAAGALESRPVTRFSVPIDPNQPLVGKVDEFTKPVQTPLSNLGSLTQTVWRYIDMGFTLLDDANHNLDVEGLWWEPFDGTPQVDFFEEFELRLSHASSLPDEGLDPFLLPRFEFSGLELDFASNPADPQVVAHPGSEGYLIEAINTVSSNGRGIAPWPMNRGVPQSEFTYWTWRDTASLIRGGHDGVGADTLSATQNVGTNSSFQGLYPDMEVPSIGLPLLMEFRTHPDDGATGQNGFRVTLAVTSSAQPYFRSFSTGGILATGKTLLIDPDQQQTAKGGVDPNTGKRTPPQDNIIYHGQADFVVRVSRLHTIWMDTGAAGTSFAAPVVEPRASEQPSQTQVVLAFRGASDLVSTGDDPEPWFNAGYLDPYGDPFDALQWDRLSPEGTVLNWSFDVTEWPVDGDESWVSDPAALAGARYVQARVTLVGNPLSGLGPRLSGLGLSYLR